MRRLLLLVPARARLAEAAGTDRGPFLALTLVCALSFAALWRARAGVAAAQG